MVNMNKNDKENQENSVGYFLGSIFGAVCITAATVLVIAGAIKILMLMF
jgi:hypothetical protein